MHICEICKNSYVNKHGLFKHQRIKHNMKHEHLKRYKCEGCTNVYTNKTKLNSHQKTHQQFQKNVLKRLKCCFTGCCYISKTYELLRSHLRSIHNCELKEEAEEFSTAEDFQNWKQHIEKESNCTYVLNTAGKKLKEGKTRLYYACHRSYTKKPRGHNIRSEKGSGSNKIGSACPSAIIATIKNERISVLFYPNHVGHLCEIGRQRLEKVDRSILAGKLQDGIPIRRLLADVREQATPESISRIHLLERQDLQNIKRDFSIGDCVNRHLNDSISVQAWVNKMQKQDNNPILYFKQQGHLDSILNINDFLLIIMTEYQADQLKKFGPQKICIDGTYGLNAYDFQLFTIVIVNEFGLGIPVSFCFSNRSDTTIFRLYFECLKEKVGIIHADVFMSDDYPAFYNAWEIVMGSTKHHLLCTWHINKNWNENINKIKNKDKKHLVLKTLKMLQKETDESTFLVSLNSFIADLQIDSDTVDFANYFIKHYSRRVQTWAYCYRKYVGINTNMYLESLHKTIKYHYLDGQKCKRLDKTLNALMNLVRDKMFENFIAVSKNKVCSKISKINKSHFKSSTISSSMITLVSSNKWQVLSSTDATLAYHVEKITESNYCVKECQLICKYCNICVHIFKCSCIDNVINFNICKHIHACSKSLNFPQITSFSTPNCAQSLIDLQPKKISNSNKIMEIQGKIDILKGLLSNASLSDSLLQSLNNKVDKMITEVSNSSTQYEIKQNINIKKKIEPQCRLYSTKKKKNKKTETLTRTEAKNVYLSNIDAEHNYCHKC